MSNVFEEYNKKGSKPFDNSASPATSVKVKQASEPTNSYGLAKIMPDEPDQPADKSTDSAFTCDQACIYGFHLSQADTATALSQLKAALSPSENLLWAGSPDPTYVSKQRVIGMIMIAMSVLVIFLIAAKTFGSVTGGLIASALYVFYYLISAYRTSKRLCSTAYGITSQRILILSSAFADFEEIAYNEILQIDRKNRHFVIKIRPKKYKILMGIDKSAEVQELMQKQWRQNSSQSNLAGVPTITVGKNKANQKIIILLLMTAVIELMTYLGKAHH
jgi:hypothetical protein